jgi:hypothetical protein
MLRNGKVREPYEGCGGKSCDTTLLRYEAPTERYSEVHTGITVTAVIMVKHMGGVVPEGTARLVTGKPWKGEVQGSYLTESCLWCGWTSGLAARVKTQESRPVSPCSTNPRASDTE